MVFKNTFRDIQKTLLFGNSNSTRFEFECNDISHFYNLAHFVDQGLIRPPLFIQSVFGLLGGIVAHIADLAYMKRTADRLFGDDYQWSLLGAGKNQISLAFISAAQRSNVCFGPEDSLWIGPGRLAKSNADRVR